MATAAGFRYALLRIPTPGSGFDDQDRYALMGIAQPANSITPPTIGADFDSKQRAARMRIVFPDSTLDDQQDRYTYLGIVQPTEENVNISAQQRAHFCHIPMWPGGTGFTANDRFHVMGIYPYKEESFFSEAFDISFELRSTIQEALSPTTTSISMEIVVSGFSASLEGTRQAAVVDVISNSTASEVPSNYECDPMSGFKQYPTLDSTSRFMMRWDGQYVRQESLDPRHPQEYVQSGENAPQDGPQNPEPDDTFLSSTVGPEDL